MTTGSAPGYLDVQERLAAAGIPCAHLGLPRGASDFETDAEIVLVSKSRIGLKQMEQLRNCKLLIRMGVGYDNVDLDVCRDAAITVCNVDTCTEEVADSALSHVLNHFRQTARAAIAVARDQATAGHEAQLLQERRALRLRGKTLGIVGLGKIGRAVALRAAPFGLRVLFHDPGVTDAAVASLPVERAGGLHDLLGRSDCVSLHCTAQAAGPLANIGMMDAGAFAAMKDGAALVNTARGELICPSALVDALLSPARHLSAHLDCVPGEPLARGEGWLTEVKELLGSRLVITPHCAWFSVEVEQNIADLAFATCLRWSRGEALPNRLN
eukprot:TRINITY_DN67706_c0_g1_i1.p1 TRINITY_DN67706_c0_g1~~TRINITY_DN67706_c0_g1_i1.p1  ORF type:complete len:327 (-),score=71.99 TRINITY_DN67706_c0_g1_i1:200-1180(-)